MFNNDNVLERVSRAISNCIYSNYGGIGYFTDIDDNYFYVDIYDSPSRDINKMSDEEAKKHLLKSIKVPFEISSNASIAEFKAIDDIVSAIEKIVYNNLDN